MEGMARNVIMRIAASMTGNMISCVLTFDRKTFYLVARAVYFARQASVFEARSSYLETYSSYSDVFHFTFEKMTFIFKTNNATHRHRPHFITFGYYYNAGQKCWDT